MQRKKYPDNGKYIAITIILKKQIILI